MQAPFHEKNERLLQQAVQGNRLAQEALYEQNRGLVYKVVERFRGCGYDEEDLFQIGSIGLLRSIRKFDVSYGVQFSTYAIPMILGEIRNFMRTGGLVRVQRSVWKKRRLIRQMEEQLYREQGQPPTVEKLAQMLDIEREEVAAILEVGKEPGMLAENGEAVCRSRCTAEDWMEVMSLRDALQRLPEREQMILRWRFFKDETQTEIAARLGISQVQVSRIEKQALRRLRENFDE